MQKNSLQHAHARHLNWDHLHSMDGSSGPHGPQYLLGFFFCHHIPGHPGAKHAQMPQTLTTLQLPASHTWCAANPTPLDRLLPLFS